MLFAQHIGKLWIFVSFKINQHTIAKTLCVKKEIKNNTCQGRCHFKKKLNNLHKKEQKQNQTNQKLSNEVLYCIFEKTCELPTYTSMYVSKLNPKNGNDFQDSSFISEIFQPPKRSVM